MIAELSRLLDPLRRAVRSLVGRAVVDELMRQGRVQRAQIVTEGGGALGDIEYIEPFGFTGSPPDGRHPGVYVRPNGDGSQTILLCLDGRQYRLEIDADEAAIYNSQGDYAHVKNNGEVHVKASVRVLAETPLFEASADCLINGNLQVLGDTQVMGATRLMTNTSIEAGNLVVAATAAFSAPVGFASTVQNAGTDIGATHEHTGGTENDGTTGTVV